ncbi:MAG: hypothetical protein ACFFD2_14985 [Promethearchaeota archaeon]
MDLIFAKIEKSEDIYPPLNFNKSSVFKYEDDKINCIITKDSMIIANENLAIIKILHSLLLTDSNLTNKQKLDYCESERYFMKLYLGEIIKNLNSRIKFF